MVDIEKRQNFLNKMTVLKLNKLKLISEHRKSKDTLRIQQIADYFKNYKKENK